MHRKVHPKVMYVLCRNNRNAFLCSAVILEFYCTFNECKNSMVFPHTYTVTRFYFCSSLSDDDIAWDDFLTTKLFNAETTSDGITVILGRPLTFLVCHSISLCDFSDSNSGIVSSETSFEL